MNTKRLRVFICAGLLGGAAFAQTQTKHYLDVMTVKVKPEKYAEFETLAKRIADINRQYKGEHWLALGTIFGEGETLKFVVPLTSYADIEQHHQLFHHAMSEALTPSGMTRFMNQVNGCLASSSRELRLSRMDLSFNVPSDQAELNKLVGQARWVRTLAVRVREGRNTEFEDLAQMVKSAAEKATYRVPTAVSQSVLGKMGSLYYFTSFEKSLEGFDKRTPLREMLGDEAYQKFLKGVADTSLGSEAQLFRFNPQLSNPPEEIAAGDPEFWKPKPAASASKHAPAAAPQQARADTGVKK